MDLTSRELCASGSSRYSARNARAKIGAFGKTHVVHYTHIARYTHFVHIETFRLDFRPDTKTDGDINEFENDVSENSDYDDVRTDADTLRNELRCVAIEQSPHSSRNAVPAVAVRSVRKKTKAKT